MFKRKRLLINRNHFIYCWLAIILGFTAFCITLLDCYRFAFESELTLTPFILIIGLPAGGLLWITWRKEIKNLAIIPSLFLAACSACVGVIILSQTNWADAKSFCDWFKSIGFFLLGIILWLSSGFIFDGSLSFFNRYFRRNTSKNTEM